jgi:hypothetical protein
LTKLANVNTADVRDAIRLGCLTMSAVFNADDGDVPFFESRVRPEAYLRFHEGHSEAHVPGRHLNALLNAEDAAGIRIDEGAVDKHARAAFLSYSGSVPLPLNRARIGGQPVNFLPHNVREGFHALYALAKYRDSSRANLLAEASIDAIFKYWHPVRGWDRDRLGTDHAVKLVEGDSSTFITGLARAIGPLVKYYRAAGYAPALELALVLKEKAIHEFFTEDGRYARQEFGTHTHSTTCVMSSLAQLADLTGDSHLMGRVKAFYNNGLWQIRDSLGWVVESSGPDADPDRGEVNNTGDVVETALILGRWGHTECYQDAERIIRGHLLPSQVRDTAFIVDPPNPQNEDGKRDIAARHVGAFGFPAPYGHEPVGSTSVGFNMDIVGGAVGSLCEVLREATRSDRAGHWVNLLFDHEAAAIEVESPYTHRALRVRVKRPGPLFLRVPHWVDVGGIELQGTDEVPRHSNGYLFIARPPVDRVLSFDFPLATREITLAHRTRRIRVRLRGDEVVAMDNFSADLTFFDPIE